MVNVVTEIIFLISMATACIFGYRQITKLDVNKHSISLLDDLLLFVCIPAFFVDTLFGIVPAVQWCNGFSISFTLLQVNKYFFFNLKLIDKIKLILYYFVSVNASVNSNSIYYRRFKTL